MKKWSFLLCILIVSCLHALDGDYWYPVFVESDSIYALQVKPQDTATLYKLKSDLLGRTPLLPSFFDPINVMPMPDQQGFSFVDIHTGRLYIKHWNRRQPKSPPLDYVLEPIYEACWLDATTCCVVAKRHNCLGIYRVGIDGAVDTLISFEGFDCYNFFLYGNKLVFVKEDKENDACSLVLTSYQPDSSPAQGSLFEPRQPSISATDCYTLTTRDNDLIGRPVIHNDDTIFFIAMQQDTAEENLFAHATYRMLTKQHTTWTEGILFSFRLPIALLHEVSGNTFLPYHTQEAIYFVSTDDCEQTQIFSYDLTTKEIHQLTNEEEGAFGPLPLPDGSLVYGGREIKKIERVFP